MPLDVQETSLCQTIYPGTAPPGIAILNLNVAYLRRGFPVQQMTTLHLTVPFATGVPTTFPELFGRTTDLFRGLPQGATLDAFSGVTLPCTL